MLLYLGGTKLFVLVIITCVGAWGKIKLKKESYTRFWSTLNAMFGKWNNSKQGLLLNTFFFKKKKKDPNGFNGNSFWAKWIVFTKYHHVFYLMRSWFDKNN